MKYTLSRTLLMIVMCFGMVRSISLIRNKGNKHSKKMNTDTICKRSHDYCGFIVVHSATKIQTPIPGWCECDKAAGMECMFSTVNSRKQWLFTCQKPDAEVEDEDEEPLRITFQEVLDQYRRNVI